MHINFLRFFLQMNSCIINIGNTGIFANVLDGIEIEYFIENEVEDMFHFDGILVGIASLCIIGIFHDGFVLFDTFLIYEQYIFCIIRYLRMFFFMEYQRIERANKTCCAWLVSSKFQA